MFLSKKIYKSEELIINFLIVGFFLVPIWGEILPFVFIFFLYNIKNYKFNYYSFIYLFILFYFCLYVFIANLQKGAGIEVVGRLIYPILFFLIGFIFFKKYGEISSANLKLNSAVSFFVFCILSVSYTVLNYGSYSDFSGDNGRVIYEYITGVKYSNTLINGFLCSSMVLLPLYMLKNNTLSKGKNIFIFFISIISIYVGILLGNRSTFVILLFVFLFLILIEKFNFWKLSIIVLGSILYYLVYFSNSTLGKRMNSDEGLDNSRLRNWLEGVDIIVKNPLLGSDLRTKDVFAHNLFLDVAIPYGVFPMFILFIMYFFSIYIFIKFLFLKRKNFFSLYFMSLFIAINLIFMIEPAYQGLFKLFCFYCLIMGMGFSYFSKREKDLSVKI